MRRKQLLLLSILTVLMTFSVQCSFAINVVFDKWATEAVVKNTGRVYDLENKHNAVIDSIKMRQQKIQQYTATMETIKEMYRMSMQNVNGFGQESAYYKVLVSEYSMMAKNIVRATNAIFKCPGINYVNSLNEIVNIQLEAASIAKTFVDVVNNGKVSIKDFTTGKNDALNSALENAGAGKGDGYNFLDRYTRMDLCGRLISKASSINMRLEQIIYICNYCRTLSNLIYHIDPDTWIDMISMANVVENLKRSWETNMGGTI